MLEKCKSTLLIVDDYGDNYATMHCQLRANHKSWHKEIYYDNKKIIIAWENDIMTLKRRYK